MRRSEPGRGERETAELDLAGRATTAPLWLASGLEAGPAEEIETPEQVEARVRQQIAEAISQQFMDCPDHPNPRMPRPSCWQCARNGMVSRCIRIAAGTWRPRD